MSGAEDPDISVARGNFIVILISIFILFSIAIFYHIVGQESIETYVDILWAIGPTLLLIAGILSYWFFFSTVGNPILNILLGNVYINIINSVYFRSRVRLLRRRFFPRNTSLQHLLTSKVYKRITNRIDSKFLVGFHYIVVLAIVLSLSISTTYIFVQENTLYLGDIWDRSTIWTIARLHFASLSLGLVMIVFALNFLERNISPLEHGSVLVRSTLIIRIIIISTTISVSILLIPLLSDQISDTIYKYIVVFNFVLFPIVLLSIFVIMEKIIQIFLSSPDEIHLSSVKSKIVKLAIMGREKEYATEILDSVSMGISNEVAESSTPYAQITAHDIGAKPGDYIVDINKKTVENLLDCPNGNNIHAKFNVTIGDRINRKSEPVLNIVNKVEERKINRLRDEFGSAIRHKNFDPWYEQDSWEQNYSIIDHFLGDIEENINECIHRSTMPSIEYNLFLYRQIIWNIVYNSAFQSIPELPKQPLDTVLSSIHRVFVDCITSSEIPEDRKSQIVLKMSEFIYTLSNNIKEEFGEVTGYKKNKDLLRKFKEDAEIHDPESAKEIEQLLRELE